MTPGWVLAQLAALLVTGCEMFGIPWSALDACTGPARDYAGQVIGAFNTTVGAVRRL